MARVVVMGAGLGGVACAYEMKKKLGKGHEVAMVGSSAYFEFTPSNPWIMVGWRTPPQTRVELAKPLASKDIRWIPQMVDAIDAPGSTLRAGERTEISGIAWDGGSGVARVEVSLDSGATWREAKLGRDMGRYSWRQWRHDFKPKSAGVTTVLARATARDGSTQSDKLVHNPAGYHHNVVQRADYHVA